MSKLIFRAVLLLSIFSLSNFFYSCSKTSLVSNWENTEVHAKIPFNSFAIVAVMGAKMSSNIFEQGVINSFRKKGITVIRDDSHFQSKDKYTKKQFQDSLKNTQVDAVMFFKLLGLVKERSYVPPTSYYSPYGGPYYGRYNYPYSYPYWYPSYDYTPGYWTVDDNFEIEMAVYTTDDKLLYTARTNTLNPKGSIDLGESVGKKIYKNLKKHKIIIKQKK